MQHFLWLGICVESLPVQRKGICGMYVLPKCGNVITSITDTQDRSDRRGTKSLSFITTGKISVFLPWCLYTPPPLLPLHQIHTHPHTYTHTHTHIHTHTHTHFIHSLLSNLTGYGLALSLSPNCSHPQPVMLILFSQII